LVTITILGDLIIGDLEEDITIGFGDTIHIGLPIIMDITALIIEIIGIEDTITEDTIMVTETIGMEEEQLITIGMEETML
jgi:hypothetical protein